MISLPDERTPRASRSRLALAFLRAVFRVLAEFRRLPTFFFAAARFFAALFFGADPFAQTAFFRFCFLLAMGRVYHSSFAWTMRGGLPKLRARNGILYS